jgi:tRNA threonylcarbamoyl adenosine modification protein (Sua5/YciO/YrdC/YwlC family)
LFLKIHEQNPQERSIKLIVECLFDGGVIIYPTDTIYGLGCNIFHQAAIERICILKKVQPEKAQLSFICNNLSHLSDYAKSISTPMYRILKEYLPGPYTFILPASKQVPKILKSRKSTIGLRIPNHKIAMEIIRVLGNPILSASLPGAEPESYTDPEIIYRIFKNDVDIVVDGGIGGIIPSTIIDLTASEPVVLREGLGVWNGPN